MRIVLSGAGISGLAAAIALSPLASSIELIERAPGPRPEGYFIDFAGRGAVAAARLGVLDALRERGRHFDEIWEADPAGRIRHRFSLRALKRYGGERYFHILRPQIEEVLRERLPGNARIRFGERIADIEDEPGAQSARVSLASGAELSADLVLIAEGLRSPLRDRLLEAGRDPVRGLGIASLAWIADDPELARRLDGNYAVSRTIGAQLGVAPLTDGRVSVYGIERWAGHAAPPIDDASIRERYAVTGAFGRRLLRSRPERVYCDLAAQVELPAWRRGRVAAIGDAAHAASLISGQGAQLAIAGAEALGRALADAVERGESLAAGFDDYERQWRPVVERVQRVARRNAPAFAPRRELDLVAKDLVMAAVTLPGLDRIMARVFTGRAGGELASARARRADAG